MRENERERKREALTHLFHWFSCFSGWSFFWFPLLPRVSSEVCFSVSLSLSRSLCFSPRHWPLFGGKFTHTNFYSSSLLLATGPEKAVTLFAERAREKLTTPLVTFGQPFCSAHMYRLLPRASFIVTLCVGKSSNTRHSREKGQGT